VIRSKPEEWLSDRQLEFYAAVLKPVEELQRKATDDTFRYSDVAARLARLRRAVNAEPGSVPDVWADTIGVLPEGRFGSENGPSQWERAAHTAITLFAIHAQGKTTAIHRRGPSLGAAVRRFDGARSNGEISPVFRRFQALATSASEAELNHHLRAMITLLRSEGTQLDYGLLAVDLHGLSSPMTEDRVRLRWGRDYHRTAVTDAETAEPTSQTEST